LGNRQPPVQADPIESANLTVASNSAPVRDKVDLVVVGNAPESNLNSTSITIAGNTRSRRKPVFKFTGECKNYTTSNSIPKGKANPVLFLRRKKIQ
jgi:hypothetical protein